MKLTCENCHNEFKGQKRRGKLQKTCSRKCSDELKFGNTKIICQNCNKEFKEKPRKERSKQQKTCSTKCRRELEKKEFYEIRVCVFCEENFVVKKSSKKHKCSRKCIKKDRKIKQTCQNCNQEFERLTLQKTCSRECAADVKKRNSREIRECVYCHKHFETKKTKENKLCSDDCRIKWNDIPENKEYRLEKTWQAFENKFGTRNILALDFIKDKIKATNLDVYGFEYAAQNEDVKKKIIETNLKNTGFEHSLQSPEIREKGNITKIELYNNKNYNNREKFKETNIKNLGVPYPSQNSNIFEKQQKTAFKILPYKTFNINYQGSYELCFLEQMEKIDLINEVSRGQSFKYLWEGEQTIYYSDFLFRGKIIEIKSTYTYNKGGKDIELGLKNEAKWQAVRDSGVEIDIIITNHKKKEILDYVTNLKPSI